MPIDSERSLKGSTIISKKKMIKLYKEVDKNISEINTKTRVLNRLLFKDTSNESL